jgi:hypothetical protein
MVPSPTKVTSYVMFFFNYIIGFAFVHQQQQQQQHPLF